MIRIDNLKKSFGDNLAVDIENIDIQSGTILGLVGNNGAGKTTLFRLMLDLLQADSGQIELTFEGGDKTPTPINPASSEEWKQLTGAYIDEAFLIDFLTPEEYFEFIGRAYAISKEDTFARLGRFTAFMQEEVLGKKKLIRDLSAGNKQKVGIIAALLPRPQLVVLDEPFNFLDPSSQIILKRLLAEYHAETNATILISSHNLQHTVDISTRIALMEHGQIVKNLNNQGGNAEQELEDYFNSQMAQ